MKVVAGISGRQTVGVFFLFMALIAGALYEEEAEAARRGRGGVRRGGARNVRAGRGGPRRGGRRQAQGRRRGRGIQNVQAGNNNNNVLNFGVGGLNDLALAGRGFNGGFGNPFGIGGFNQQLFNANDQIAVLNDPFNRNFGIGGGFGGGFSGVANPVVASGFSGQLPQGFTPLIGPNGTPVQNVFQSPNGLVEALPGAFANGRIANPQSIQAFVTDQNGKPFAGQNRSLDSRTLNALQTMNGQGAGLDALGLPKEPQASRAPAEAEAGRPVAQ